MSSDGTRAQTEQRGEVARRSVLGFETSPPVFITSAVLIIGLALFGVLWPTTAEDVFAAVMDFIATQFGWFYTIVVSAFLVFVLWVGLGRYGRIRLGPDDARPDYSYLTWFAMLFSAGMGIGVLFWSVAEPLNHFAIPPYGEAETAEAARQAINLTYLHWGLHGWGIYVVVGLALAYFAYRRDLPMAMRSMLHPLLGDRIYGPVGHAVDVFAILGTMFGVATTLGLGAQQIAAGMAHVFPIEANLTLEVWIVVLATLAAIISVVSGLDRGIKRLSQAAIALAVVMFGYVLLAGPTAYALSATVENIGYYLQRLPETALRGSVYADSEWMADWTLFYWGWWLAWSPFVGVFIARISRGRTIREFVFGVMLVPTTVVFVWYGVFGNLGLRRVLGGETELLDVAVDNMPAAIFAFFEAFPLTMAVSLVGILVILIYFVTSSDSASFVIDMLAAGGHPDPPRRSRVFWATSEGLIATMLLLAGGLDAMRSFQITTGLPLAVLLIAICVALVSALRHDPGRRRRERPARPTDREDRSTRAASDQPDVPTPR
jgi:choline/glycine/proline betaine transport protein